VARGKSIRLLGEIPKKYSPDFMERLDRRTVLGKAVSHRFEAVAADCGGLETLAHAKIGLIRRFLWMECVIEGLELQLAAGEQIDIGTYTQLTNTWLGLARTLGLERKSRSVRRLHEHLAEAS
jgi:hypothetical protein